MLTEQRTAANNRLCQQGLLAPESLLPTRRWHGALARAAGALVENGQRGADLRLPIAMALMSQFGRDCDEQHLVDMVEVMLGFIEPDGLTH